MASKRRNVNIALIALSLILGVWAARLIWQPTQSSMAQLPPPTSIPDSTNDLSTPNLKLAIEIDTVKKTQEPILDAAPPSSTSAPPQNTRFRDADIASFGYDNPFRAEAQKVMSGHLEETDSISRHRILSYCEHLRTSYTTRDIDFIRQVFSDNALIIVGHTVKTGRKDASSSGNKKVSYSIRSKKEYIERLEKIFNANKKIDVGFSNFKILRHPTMNGIYGVTLRQKYSCDQYSDDGYLFLLWDFRDPSMPLIHVRTWQPAPEIINGTEDVIEIGDFNLE